MMRDLINSLLEDVSQMIDEELYASFKSEIRNEHNDFSGLEKEITDVYLQATEPNLKEQKTKVLGLISKTWSTSEGIPFSEFAHGFAERLQTRLDALPDRLKVAQDAARFTPQAGDGQLVRSLKLIKNGSHKCTTLPGRIANIFRKTPKPLPYWAHEVPLRAIATFYIQGSYVKAILKIREQYYIPFSTAYQELKTWEEHQAGKAAQPAPQQGQQLAKSFIKVRKELKKELRDTFLKVAGDFSAAAEKVGTWELRGQKYKATSLQKHLLEGEEYWQKEDAGWHNTFDALFEEWRADLEVFKLIAGARADLDLYASDQEDNLKDDLESDLSSISEYLSETLEVIADTEKDLSPLLKKANYRAQKTLDQKVVPALMEKLGSNKMVNAVNRFEASLSRALEKLTTERKIAKIPTDYMAPIELEDITTISPYELIAFEITPALTQQIDKIKVHLIGELERNITLVQDLGHMITFGLNAAIQQLQENPGAAEDARKVALESLKRTQERIADIREALAQLIDGSNEELKAAVGEYIHSLEALTVNENVREIRMRIMKAKAIRQTKAYKEGVTDTLKNQISRISYLATSLVKAGREIFTRLSKRFTIPSGRETVSREVSDFLTESHGVVNALPVIYRNLYRIEPLSDYELYVGRQMEYDLLIQAYTNWEKGRPGPAAIIGEKWSGLSSFVNFALQKSPFHHAVTRITCDVHAPDSEHLLHSLHQILESEVPTSLTACIEPLNSGPGRIIIIEDLQNLYLRKVGGFAQLKDLLELISHTSKNIFWVSVCTIYSWHYLQRTLRVNEVFGYLIQLQKPTAEELNQIVEKRNRVSGYKIVFDPSPEEQKSKKFQKLDENGRQAYLKERFFKNLIDFSESNISMAIMYWLLSTKSVDQNTIVIDAFRKPDLAFLAALGMDKILTLHQLILHDGLTLEQYTDVARLGRQSAFLMLSTMKEDGILIKKDDFYTVNPLVYRSVVTLLKAKNLIY